jgi:hypothetical protein
MPVFPRFKRHTGLKHEGQRGGKGRLPTKQPAGEQMSSREQRFPANT